MSEEEVWRAVVDHDVTVRYFYGTRVDSTWKPGAATRYSYPDGMVAADGGVIAIDAPHRPEMYFRARWDPELEAEGPVREAWRVDGYTEPTVELWDLDPASRTFDECTGGLPFIISGRKTFLETGTPLASAG